MLAPAETRSPSSAPTIAVMALLFLAAMALAIPAAPIERGVGGLLVGPAQLSEAYAEALSQAGYGFVAVDLTDATVDGENAYWVRRLEGVRRRQFPVWGWIDSRMEPARVSSLLGALGLSGVYVWGPDAVAVAHALRADRPGLEVVPVLRPEDAPPAGEPFAVAMEHEEFLRAAARVERPVLLADRLDATAVRAARKSVDGACLVTRVPVARGR